MAAQLQRPGSKAADVRNLLKALRSLTPKQLFVRLVCADTVEVTGEAGKELSTTEKALTYFDRHGWKLTTQ